jgi:hypothetical protein
MAHFGPQRHRKKTFKDKQESTVWQKKIHMKIIEIETEYFLSNFPYYFQFHPLEDIFL